jgi:hypothetical protein
MSVRCWVVKVEGRYEAEEGSERKARCVKLEDKITEYNGTY